MIYNCMVWGKKCQKCNLLVCCKFQIQPAPLQQNIARIAKPAKSGKERLGWIWLDWLVSTVSKRVYLTRYRAARAARQALRHNRCKETIWLAKNVNKQSSLQKTNNVLCKNKNKKALRQSPRIPRAAAAVPYYSSCLSPQPNLHLRMKSRIILNMEIIFWGRYTLYTHSTTGFFDNARGTFSLWNSRF